MGVTYLTRTKQAKDREEAKDLREVFAEVSKVNAVEGLANAIRLQQDRCEKLRRAERRMPLVLDDLTREMRLLKDMYRDVIQFQTSATALSFLKQEASIPGGLKDGMNHLMQDIACNDNLQEATAKALALLELLSPHTDPEAI